ncbi:MAG: diguanylate cyclase [Desulfobacterales bacterium]|nr:diguanylate cyclase [Desulfobacterales bacterium]
MNQQKENENLKKFSLIIIDELRKISSKKQPLSSDTLYAHLSSRPDIKECFIKSEPTQHTPIEEPKKTVEVKTGAEDPQKREKLLKQIIEIGELSNFYKNTLIMMLDLLRVEENKSFHAQIDAFRRIVKEEEQVEELKTALKTLKDIIFKGEDIKVEKEEIEEKTSGSEKGGVFSFLKRKKKTEDECANKNQIETNFLKQLKKGFEEIYEGLRLNLDNLTLGKLNQIEKRIRWVSNINDYLSTRKDIILLIQDYISRVNEDRLQAAAAIKEIGERFTLVETHILNAFESARDTFSSNNDFNSTIHEQMEELKTSVNFSKTLAELKTSMVSRLAIIEEAIKKKRDEDVTRKNDSEKQLHILEEEVKLMRSEIAKSHEKIKALEGEILTDPLTAIYNRRAYDRHLKEEFQRYLRYNNVFSLLIYDIDHFKKINDKYGHAVGDTCIKEIIASIKPVLRKSDFFARFGGEEFVIILPETKIEDAFLVAEKIRITAEQIQFFHKAEEFKITISIGVSQIEPSDQSCESLFIRADKALYDAKNTGRNKVIKL